MRRLLLSLGFGLLATSASAEYGFDDGSFDIQAASVGGYCYFMLANCPTGGWDGTSAAGFIQSATPAWGSVPAHTPGHYAFVQIAGSLTKTFTATASGDFRLSWYHADRPTLGGQTYVVTVNGVSVGTFSPQVKTFVRVVSAPFSLTAGNSYTVAFTGQSPGVDRSALIDSVQLVPAIAQNAYLYSYDARGRLTRAADSNGFVANYTLDKADNRSNVQTYNQFATFFSAISLPHQVGFAEAGAWAANSQTGGAYMTYGPYTTAMPTGSRVGAWRVLIDDNVASNVPVITIDVWDATTGTQLAVRTVYRSEWPVANNYVVQELPFTLDASRAGHAIELRTFHHATAHVRVEKIGYR